MVKNKMQNLKPRLVKCKGKQAYQSLLKASLDTVTMKSGLVILRPGESVGTHVTTGKEEAIIILEGRAAIACGLKRPLIATQECVVYIPPETTHDVKNIGEEPLRYVYVVVGVEVHKNNIEQF